MPEIYKGLYKDGFGTSEIKIENNFETLVTEIDGVVFSGSEFDELTIDDKSRYTDKELARFTFLRTPGFQTGHLFETLCNCSFQIVVPQIVIDKITNAQFNSNLEIEIYLGNARDENPGSGLEYEYVTLTLIINGKKYKGKSDLFEPSFDQIRDQIKDRYQLKNCYGCMYGDYNVCGQGTFGTMLCFKNQKSEYSRVASKCEYMDLAPPYGRVQEIYCCDQFEVRKEGAGYRG